MPLLPHLKPKTRYAEPCCGDMSLIRHLNKHGHRCYWASDIEQRCQEQECEHDALMLTTPLKKAGMIITNTPWSRDILHPMIEHFRNLAPTWLLFDTDWAFTKQSSPYMPYCHKIVAIGRVKWFPETKSVGKDNCAWVVSQFETIFQGKVMKALTHYGIIGMYGACLRNFSKTSNIYQVYIATSFHE